MSRKINADPPEFPNGGDLCRKGYESREYEISLVTPMFGGGVEAGAVDDSMPIRGTSIRGQLRFWWRATRGKKFSDPKDLAKEEGLIWGTTDHVSPVSLEVEMVQTGQKEACAHYPQGKNFPKFNRGYPGYALFPFQGNKKENVPVGEGLKNSRFCLCVSFPDKIAEDVETSLKAWINFGGLGARTRRGCGSLYCKELSPAENTDLDKWFVDNFGECFGASACKGQPWPVLSGNILTGHAAEAMTSWNNVIDLLKDFRQGPEVGRNPGQQSNRPGRSRWPEPDSIRRITGVSASLHRPDPEKPEEAFPRAAFGLPIISPFKDRDDPKDIELYPVIDGKRATRMSSPLILKSLALSPNRAVPLILLLDAPLPDGLELKGTRHDPLGREAIVNPKFAAYPNSPMGMGNPGHRVRSEKGSAVEAFMEYAKENSFREVKA